MDELTIFRFVLSKQRDLAWPFALVLEVLAEARDGFVVIVDNGLIADAALRDEGIQTCGEGLDCIRTCHGAGDELKPKCVDLVEA